MKKKQLKDNAQANPDRNGEKPLLLTYTRVLNGGRTVLLATDVLGAFVVLAHDPVRIVH